MCSETTSGWGDRASFPGRRWVQGWKKLWFETVCLSLNYSDWVQVTLSTKGRISAVSPVWAVLQYWPPKHPPWQSQHFDTVKSQESSPKGKRQTVVYFLSNPSPPALGIQLSCDLEVPKRNLFFFVYRQSCVPTKDDSEHLSCLKCFGFWKSS